MTRSSDGRSHPWREIAIHALLSCAIVVLLFPAVVLHGELAIPWSTLYHFSPWSAYAPDGVTPSLNTSAVESLQQTFAWYAVAQQALSAGEWPLWNPRQFCGIPLLANGQSSVFYPPRVVHAFVDGWRATSLFILLRVWLCSMTAYLCARGIGFGITASRCMGLAWMLCMLNMVWVYWPVPDTCAWVPILLLGAERVLQARYRQGFFALAFGGAMILLAGHPETAFTFALGVGVYFSVRLGLERRTGRGLMIPLAVAAGAWIPALLISAVQLLPLVEYIANSYTYQSRSGSPHSVHKLLFTGLVCFFVPRFFGANVDENLWGIKEEASASNLGQAVGNTNHVSFVYVGIAMWIAATFVIPWCRRDSVVRNRTIAIAVTGLVGLLLALEHPLLGFVHRLPLMSSIVRTYHANFLLFGLIVLGAQGVDLIDRRGFTARDLRVPAMVMSAIAAFVAFTWYLQRSTIAEAGVGDYVTVQIAIALAAGVTACCALFLLKRPQTRRVGGILLVLALCVDLIAASRGIRSTATLAEIENRPELFDRMHEVDPNDRFSLITAGIMPGLAQVYGIDILQGYEAIVPDRFRRFVVNSGDYWGKMEATTGTRYWVFKDGTLPDETEKYRRVADADGYIIYENKEAFSRTYLVGAVEVCASAEAVFERMADPDFDPTTSVLTEAMVVGAPDVPGTNVGEARITERSGNRVSIEVDAARDCALVLTDTYYPGWHAAVDGAPVPLFPANYAYRGVLIPEGRHSVTFEYAPNSFRVGLAISIVTALGSLGGIVWFLGRRFAKRSA